MTDRSFTSFEPVALQKVSAEPQQQSTHHLLQTVLSNRPSTQLTEAVSDLLREHSLSQLQQMDLDTVRDLLKVGACAGRRLLAALELGRRACTHRALAGRRPLRSAADVVSWATPALHGLAHEEVWLLSLDAKHFLKQAQLIARGGAHGCSLLPKDVLRPAVRNGAASIILVHNHPSGDPSPSPDDVQMTQTVAAACDLVGVPLLDHIIVGGQEHRSIAEWIEEHQLCRTG